MELPLNIEIMKNPYNWVILTLMVVIAGLALSLLVTPPSGGPQ
jgi:hypothetical protein